MPQPALSPQERRLATFCRLSAAAYALGAVACLALPSPFAVALFAALSTACAVVAPYPRERRHTLLPVIAGQLTASIAAALHLLRAQGPRAHGLWVVTLAGLALFFFTLFAYRSSAPGVHTGPAREAAPADGDAPKVQLGVTKT